MKNNFFFAAALLLGVAVNAQTTTSTPTSTPSTTQQPVAQTQPVADTSAAAITDAGAAIGSAYVNHPERLQGVKTETLTPELIFPVLGTYKASGSSTADVTISLDETNKGIVWVEGLQQGRFKALMKKAPATYKIPAQKSENGKTIAEGTLYLNPETNELTIVLGQSFNDADPTSFMTVSSKKNKTWQYTGVKNTDALATTPQASSQQ